MCTYLFSITEFSHPKLKKYILNLLCIKGDDREIVDLVNSLDLHILPSMNPDGFERAREGECEGENLKSGRTNSNGKDLNRNFPTWDDLVITKQMNKNCLIELDFSTARQLS
jgi:murein tripeptide amidase MpaA